LGSCNIAHVRLKGMNAGAKFAKRTVIILKTREHPIRLMGGRCPCRPLRMGEE
jgi:hypothetical protein